MDRRESIDWAARLAGSEDDVARVECIAQWILQVFEDYYLGYREMPWQARAAFEQRNYARSVEISRVRLSLYSEHVHALGGRLKAGFPWLLDAEAMWGDIERRYLELVADRYDQDLAYAFSHSVRRNLYRGEWRPVEYAFIEADEPPTENLDRVLARFPGGARIAPAAIEAILDIPGFSAPWRDRSSDARAVAARLDEELEQEPGGSSAVECIEMINAGFYRARGAYLVGRIVRDDATAQPLILALVNSTEGIFVDAVLTSEADAHNLFSSTLANLHVTSDHYHELCAFLFRIMPQRPLGLHYSTIGYNHVGKVAVMNELRREIRSGRGVLRTAVGFRGTVAIGFASPGSDYNLKVIRDQPTAEYKWGEYPGLEAVLRKYSRVHEINRTGSMLDNIIYYNLTLDRDWFDPELLDELLRDASRSVTIRDGRVALKHLIVQRKVTPLPVFLETATPEDAERAVINLGHCIKNNAAANVFNKDLDGRNYGVSRYLKVYLFDYDALEPFTEVRIRSNRDRIDGEEDLPDWVFEDGVIFLPEEIETGLRIADRSLRERFRQVHGELLTTGYWEGVQHDLHQGRILTVFNYPDERRLRRWARRRGDLPAPGLTGVNISDTDSGHTVR